MDKNKNSKKLSSINVCISNLKIIYLLFRMDDLSYIHIYSKGTHTHIIIK